MPQKNKLSPQQRHEIWTRRRKISAYKLAKEYGVSPPSIYQIWNKEVCPHAEIPLKSIRKELERTRGRTMSPHLHNMWRNIYTIVNTALGNKP